jgi:hypothetical protein
MMPVDFMLRAMRVLLYEQGFAAARAAAPYWDPQLQAVAMKCCRPAWRGYDCYSPLSRYSSATFPLSLFSASV